MDKDDDLDAALVCILISATTSVNLYDELSERCTKRKLRAWVNLRICVPRARLFNVSVY